MRVGGTVKNTFHQGDGTEKRGGETKILKRREGGWGKQAGSKSGCLKKGAGTPLRTMP